MSLQHFLRAWALQDVFNDCREDWRADIGILSIGKTFVGFRYRDNDQNIHLVLSPHLPKRESNIIRTIEGVQIHQRTVKQVSKLCKEYRNWSFSIAQRGLDGFRIERGPLHRFIHQLRDIDVPVIRGWPFESETGLRWSGFRRWNQKLDPIEQEKEYRHKQAIIECTLHQLIKIGLITDGYAVAFWPLDNDGLVIGPSFPSREQMVAFQLQDQENAEFFLIN